MRLIFLTSRLPFPADRGDRVRTNQFLRIFAREHAVTLVTFIANENERLLAKEVEAYCEEMHLIYLPVWKSMASAASSVWRDIPLQALYYRSRQMARKVDDLLSSHSFDAAYVHLFRMAPYLMNHPEIYRILDLTDLISYELGSSLPYQTSFWRMLYRLETPRIARYEQYAASRFNEVWFISKRDRDLFTEKGHQPQAQVVPNSIDDSLFNVGQRAGDSVKLLFVGHLEVKHNIDALEYLVERIMPLILREVPECELQIVGAGSSREVMRLSRYAGVRVIGYVPDLRTVFEESAISVAPLRFSAGVQFKVIEAMAAGLPVVMTSSVRAGLGAYAEHEFMVADSAKAFASQVVDLLRDKGLRQRLSRAGRAFVKTHYTSRTALDRLHAIDDQFT